MIMFPSKYCLSHYIYYFIKYIYICKTLYHILDKAFLEHTKLENNKKLK